MNQIRYIGYDSSHGPDFSLCRPDGFDSWMLVFTRTAGLFQTDGEMTEYSPGCAVLFSPGSYINYKACGDIYSDDWIRFESDESFVHTLPILNVPFQVQDREYIHGLIKLMTWQHNFRSGNGSEIIDSLFHVLFAKLRAGCRELDPASLLPHYQDLLLLRKQIISRPQEDWSVGRMAKLLHLSDGYLQDLYKRAFGVSCLEDVIACRINMARDLLLHSDMSVRQIAEFCGYNNIEHFSRQFRRTVGTSPLGFRRQRFTL